MAKEDSVFFISIITEEEIKSREQEMMQNGRKMRANMTAKPSLHVSMKLIIRTWRES